MTAVQVMKMMVALRDDNTTSFKIGLFQHAKMKLLWLFYYLQYLTTICTADHQYNLQIATEDVFKYPVSIQQQVSISLSSFIRTLHCNTHIYIISEYQYEWIVRVLSQHLKNTCYVTEVYSVRWANSCTSSIQFDTYIHLSN